MGKTTNQKLNLIGLNSGLKKNQVLNQHFLQFVKVIVKEIVI